MLLPALTPRLLTALTAVVILQDFCARVRVNNWWKDPVAQTPPLYSRLKFLKLCMISGRSVECKAAFQNMLLQRQKRKSKAQEDKRATPAALELDYHPLVHTITQVNPWLTSLFANSVQH